MLKKELAELIGVSPSMVSRLAKRGMPTDSLERAERWRRRHLEPGRTVGSRFDPNKAKPKAEPPADPAPAPVEVATPTRPRYDRGFLFRVIGLLDQRLEAEQGEFAAVLVERLRALLCSVPADEVPALPLRVWRALLWAVAVPPDPFDDEDQALTADEVAERLDPRTLMDGAEIVNLAKDVYGYSIPGLHPEAEEDEG